MKKIIITFLFSAILNGSGLSQSALTSSGGNGTGTTGSFGYTLGQVNYITLNGTTGSAVLGVQQPFLISSPTGTEYNEIDLKWNAFPNPVNDNLMLETGTVITGDFSFRLIDLNGKLIKNEKVTSENMEISFSGLQPGTYFLRIILADREIKVFKIIKF